MNASRSFTLTGLTSASVTLACFVLAPPTLGQVLIDRAFPLITDGGGGCPADPLPHHDSALQNQAPICANVLGFNANNAAAAPGPFRLAVEFELATASTVTGFNFYAYQTGSTTTSTFTGAFVTLYSGPPMEFCAALLAGDFVTDVRTASTFTGIYRSAQVGPNALSCMRPIMRITATLPAPLALPSGNYWVAWGLTGALPSGPFVPSLTYATLPPLPGVGEQFASGVWTKLYDTGQGAACPVPAPGYSVALPFQVLGTVSAGNPCAADVNGDLAVNVDDLVAVVLGWGPCSPASPCYADTDGNGFVDADDLVAVILGWGGCSGEFTLHTCTGVEKESNQWCVYNVDSVGSGPMPVGQRICIKCPMAPGNSCPPLQNCRFNAIPGNNTPSTGVNATAVNNSCGSCTQPPVHQGGFRYTRNGW